MLPYIINGGFEEGRTGWTHGGELSSIVTTALPYLGNFSARLGNPNYVCEGDVPVGSAWIEQTVFVPSIPSPELSFRYRIFTYDVNETHGNKYDLFDVKINNSLKFRDANTNPNNVTCDFERDLEWRYGTVSLDQRGKPYTITIRFENWNRPDGWFNTWTYIDDVQINP